MESIDDMELMAGMAEGNYNAFTQLYEKYIKSLTHYGLKFTDDIDTVSDCLHDIFVSIWLRKEELKITSSIKSYLIQSVRSSVIQKVKRNKKISIVNEENAGYEFDLVITPEQSFLNNEYNREVRNNIQKLLLTLTSKQREVIYLRFYQDLSFDEIASQLNLSVKACYKLMQRAMLELRQTIPNVLITLIYILKYS